ncbi:MAG: endolytic transglycosylase MltG [Parcubacteria group bacterium]|nr:endolytic transglycosylase MltG [Parcubacteria group bacterium]
MREIFNDNLNKVHGTARNWLSDDRNKYITLGFFVVGALSLIHVLFLSAPEKFPVQSTVSIENGVTLGEVATQFKEDNVVRSDLLLKLFVVLLGGDRNVMAGEYYMGVHQSVFKIARRMTSGAFELDLVSISIPEGATIADMAIIFSRRLPEFDADRFISIAGDEEGYLFPDTYFFFPNTTDIQVIDVMRETFKQNIESISSEIEAFGEPVEDVIIMASILEKEARRLQTKRKISGVLWRRISIGMPLQVDAVFPYIIGKNTFELTLEDLRNESPYNTYVHKGLPPAPIANPGLSSILAAVTPIPSDYLFYLADRNGITHYSATFEEHKKKKRLYLN